MTGTFQPDKRPPGGDGVLRPGSDEDIDTEIGDARTGANVVSVVLASSPGIEREALVLFIKRVAERVRVIEASSYAQLLGIAAGPEPVDLVVVNFAIAGMPGVPGLRELRKLRPLAPLAIYSTQLGSQEVDSVLDIDNASYLPTSMNSSAFISALGLILNGERFLPSDLYGGIRARRPARPAAAADREEGPAGHGLTQRQSEVLRQVVAGYSNKEVSRNMEIEEITVKVHLHAIFKRLGVHNRTQAATFALQRGWFKMDEGPKEK